MIADAARPPAIGRIAGIALVLALHVALVSALVAALARRPAGPVRMPIETRIIEAAPETRPELPPPAPHFTPPRPPFVPPPEVKIAAPPPPAAVSTAITNLATVRPPPAPAPPREPVTVQPRIDLAHSQSPEYPPVSRRLGEQGSVVLEVQVGADGRALDVKIVQSSGFARLDQAAVAGVKANYRFVPGTLDGAAHAMPYIFKFTWKLQ